VVLDQALFLLMMSDTPLPVSNPLDKILPSKRIDLCVNFFVFVSPSLRNFMRTHWIFLARSSTAKLMTHLFNLFRESNSSFERERDSWATSSRRMTWRAMWRVQLCVWDEGFALFFQS
jgi:hypothetical protein